MGISLQKENINFNKIYYYSTLIFAFTMPLSRASISFFILLLGITWLYEGNLKSKFLQIWANPILKAIVLFLSFTLLSILWSDDIKNSLNILRLYSYWIIIFVLATSIKKENISTIITAFLYGMFFSELIAYGIYFELWSYNDASVTNPSPFMFWIDYSVFLAFTSILLLNRLFSKEYTLIEKIPIALFFISTNMNLFIGQGRTGQVALIVAILIMTIIHLRFNIKSLVLSLVLITSLYTLAYNFSNNFQTRVNYAISDIQRMQTYDFNSSLGIRVMYWVISYEILQEHPLIGVGIGDYKDAIVNVVEDKKYDISKTTSDFIKDSHAHNQFLMVLIQTGFIGFILMLNILYQITRLKIANKEMKELSILFIAVYFISCITEPLWFKQFTLVLFILFIGLFIVSSKEESLKE